MKTDAEITEAIKKQIHNVWRDINAANGVVKTDEQASIHLISAVNHLMDAFQAQQERISRLEQRLRNAGCSHGPAQ